MDRTEIRDMFAASALAAMMDDDGVKQMASERPDWPDRLAETAYQIAEAMLEARGRAIDADIARGPRKR